MQDMQGTIVNDIRIILRIDEVICILENIGVQTVSIEIVKGGFKSVYEPEVQRLVRILSEVKANVEI